MGYTGSRVWIALLSLLAVQVCAGTAIAQECPAVGQLYSIDGDVSVQRHGAWQRGVLNQSLCARDAVRTGSLSRAAVMLVNEAVLRIDQNSTIYLTDVATDDQKPSVLDLARGAFQSFSRRPRALEVNTPYLNAAVQGTEFVIRAEAGKTTLTTFEGVVRVSNQSGSTSVGSGQSVSAGAGQAPRPFILVRPWDAVQWGLYYPPILAIGETSGLRPELVASLERAKRHDIAGALAALNRVPGDERDGTFYLLEAALLLSVGRVDEALSIINRAIARNDRAGLAYALRAVIEVVKNEKVKALADAKRGVALEPKAAAARIALSYAQQANFDLKGARDTLIGGNGNSAAKRACLGPARRAVANVWISQARARGGGNRPPAGAGPRARAARIRLYCAGRVPHQSRARGLYARDRTRFRRSARPLRSGACHYSRRSPP